MEGSKSPMVAEKALLGSPIDLEAALGAMGVVKTTSVGRGGLTMREMDALRAVSDTLLPSLNLSDMRCGSSRGRAPESDNNSVSSLFETSASMLGTPEIVEEYISERMQQSLPLLRWLLRLALWLLSTWYGTFIFCGALSLSSRFPYFLKFSQVDPQRREEILLRWAESSFGLYRQLFRGLKFLVLLFYFTQVNEKKENPTWKALDYCGPDPEHTTQLKSNNNNNNDNSPPSIDRLGPLHKGLVYMESPRETLSSALSHAGLSLTTRPHTMSGRHSKPLPTIQCDAVIVGSGSGGGVVAGVLAQAGYKVVVLEKGNYHARHNLALLEGQAMEKMYEGGGLLVTGNTGVIILAGSSVGGGSTINWAASLRTPDHVVSEWRNQHGIELFGSDLYAHALNTVCCRIGVQNEVNDDNLNNSVLRCGCEELGYPVNNIPRNAPPDHYCGWCCFGCKDGRKKGTGETWLVDMLDSGNGIILPGCKATKVLHVDKGRKRNVASGVMFEYENGWSGETETFIIESKVTVVACGALCTPVLLKKSGLKNPNIGKNLHLHPVVMVWGYFPETETGNDKKSYEGGIMTAMSTVISNSSTSGYGALIQTPQLHPGMFSVVMPWISGMDFKERMARFSRTTHMFALARDKGSGTVESTGAINYNMKTSDEENLKKGVEKMLRIVTAAGAVEIGTHHCKGERLNVKTASSHEFERFVKEASKRTLRDLSTPICSAHQMGSCRMGVSPETSAVNPNGETWEVEGLYVADASVFPTALGVNPMVTIQAIAYCTAQSVMEELRRKIRKKNSSSNNNNDDNDNNKKGHDWN